MPSTDIRRLLNFIYKMRFKRQKQTHLYMKKQLIFDVISLIPMPLTFIIALLTEMELDAEGYPPEDYRFYEIDTEKIYEKACKLGLFDLSQFSEHGDLAFKDFMSPLILDTKSILTSNKIHTIKDNLDKIYRDVEDYSSYPRFGLMVDKINRINLFLERRGALLQDRTENVIKIWFTLSNINKEELDLIKEIRIEIETDRGDSKTLIFDNFYEHFTFGENDSILSKNELSFKIDSNYRTKPRIELTINNCDVIYKDKEGIPEKLKKFKEMLNLIKNQKAYIFVGGKFGRFIEDKTSKLVFFSFFIAIVSVLANLIEDFSFWIQIIGYGLILIAVLGIIIKDFKLKSIAKEVYIEEFLFEKKRE